MKPTAPLYLALLGGLALAPATSAAPAIPPWGLNLGYIDHATRPGDDFFTYANGNWLKTAVIPADRTFAGDWLESVERADDRLKSVVAELHTRTDLSPEEQKLRDLYDAYTDTTRIEASGLAPLQKDLDAIASLRTLDDVAREMALPSLRLGGPFNLNIGPDDKNPNAYVVFVRQGGLGLPNRDYYLRDDKEIIATREAYQKYLARTLVQAGVPEAAAATRAAAVYALEHDIAVAHWPAADRRDANKMYNPFTIPKLKALAPGYPWDAALGAADIPLQARGADRTVIVSEKSAFPPLAKLFAATPIPVWRDYLTIRCIHAFASYLPRSFEDADFAFYGMTLRGQKAQQERAKRGVRFVDRRMGEALGKIYVAEYFPPEAKAKVRALVDNLLAALGEDLKTLDWMTPATRAKARDKLEHFTVKVGYPDHWRDYAALTVDRHDLVASVKSSNEFDWHHDADRIDEPVDKTEWGMSPPTVNAYYNSSANEIVFPAGMLQPPHFDPDADDAVNYGGIGCVIGHEVSHGFDDQGSKYDGTGMLRNWWTDADRKKFDERTGELARQYDEFEALPGLHVNGKLTLGENIGDLSGLAIAHEAYRISLHGKEAPVLDGLTGDQRFYLAFAQSWRAVRSDATLRSLVLSNPHSPEQFRVDGVTRNDDGWYAAFPEVKPGDRYYLPPEKRVRLW